MANFRKRMRPLLGSYVEVGVPDGPCADTVIDSAFRVIEEVQAKLNRHDPASELSCLNGARGKGVSMSPMSVCILRLAKALMVRSDGLFNCTVGSEVLGSAGDIEIQRLNVRLKKPIQITLDGIAKGYAVDLALKALRAHGAACGWVNAGGDLAVFGDLELPIWLRDACGAYRMAGRLKNAALATSIAQHESTPSFPACAVHPFGGEIREGVVSVLAPRAWLADALTKVAIVASPETRAATVARLGGRIVQQSASVSA